MIRARPGVHAVLVVVVALTALLGVLVPGSTSSAPAAAPALAEGGSVGPPGATWVAPAFVPAPSDVELGPAAGNAPMNVLVGLASPDASGETAQAMAEYLPGSQSYHHYLTPSQVDARYAPNPTTVASAVAYFAAYGLSTQPLSGGTLLSVTGPTANVGSAFGTSFDQYRSPTGRIFVTHPTPAVLGGGLPWTGAYGLGNTTPLVPLAAPLADPTAVAGPAASCSPGSAGLSPCQIWGAYDSSGLIGGGDNGSGVRIAVVDQYDAAETQDQLASDLHAFDTTFSLPNPTVSFNYPVPGPANLNSTDTGWGLEEALDLEWSHAAAPGASIAVTFSPNPEVGLYEDVDWLVAHHLVDVISLSWGEPDVGLYNAFAGVCRTACNASSDGSYALLGPVLEAAALEGISVFAASGDCGSADGTSGVATNYPSSDPFVTGVGGTYLTVSSTGTWESEVAWSGNASGRYDPGCQNQGGSGGGYAPLPRPWWQYGEGVPASPAARGDPDVSADASDGVEIVEGGSAGGVGGTSLASPLWAGMAAVADQVAGAPLGYLNPTLYSILRSTNYTTDFHDIVSGNNGAYSAARGWDPVTGIGTPIEGKLVLDLARAAPAPSSLEAFLYAGPRTGTAPLSVAFHVAANGGSDEYSFEDVAFGDGTAAVAVDGSTSHTYTAAGVYDAQAYVVDSSGNVSVSEPFPIIVGGGAQLTVNLSASTTTPSLGATVLLTATVHGGTAPYLYTFYYGDGTYLNGTASNSTSHAYEVVGGVCADVLVEDSADPVDGGASAGLALQVGGGASPICVNDSTPLTVQAEAQPPVLDAPADFPSLFQVYGGSEGSGTGIFTEQLSSSDPYVAACQCTIFRAPGNYTVSLNASDPAGGFASNSTEVTVAPALVGAFSASPTYGVAPLTVHFAATASGGWHANASATVWSFGNGSGSLATGANVTATYALPGVYFATADLSDQGHGNASELFLVDVVAASTPSAPTVALTVAPAVNVTSGTAVRFSATSQLANGGALPEAVNWTLWDGASVLGPTGRATVEAPADGSGQGLALSVNVSWPTLGSYFANRPFSVISSNFLAVESGGFVPRADALEVTAQAGPAWGLLPLAWRGAANASGPGVEVPGWSFGDGSGANGSTVSHVYDVHGLFNASVTVNDSWGDTVTYPFGVNPGGPLYPALTVSAGVSVASGTAPLTVDFSAAAAGGNGLYFYAWTFGDGTGAATNFTQHTYTKPGNFSVQLVVQDQAQQRFVQNWTIDVSANATHSSSGPATIPWALVVTGAIAVGLVAAVALLLVGRRRRPPTSP